MHDIMVERSSSRPQATTDSFYYDSDVDSSTSENSEGLNSSRECFVKKSNTKARTTTPTKETPTKVVETKGGKCYNSISKEITCFYFRYLGEETVQMLYGNNNLEEEKLNEEKGTTW